MISIRTNATNVRDPKTGKFLPVDMLGGNISKEIDSWLNAHPEATTTVTDGSVTRAKLADDVAVPIFGDDAVLPCVITEELADYYVSGDYVFACPNDNLVDSATIKNDCYDKNTLSVVKDWNGAQLCIPITDDMLNKVLYTYRKAFYVSSIDSYTTIEIAETSSSNGLFATKIKSYVWGDAIDLSEVTFTEGLNRFIKVSSGNHTSAGSIIAMYIGYTDPAEVFAEKYVGNASAFIGRKVYAAEGTRVYLSGVEDAIKTGMPSFTSSLLVNADGQLEKMETPYRFTLQHKAYLNHGEHSYFCWNHNKLRYDKTIHRFVYICKNKNTHAGGGGNVYMYKIDPCDPLSATPEKIYVGDAQITWLQGFVILEDGTWLLPDCSMSGYDAPQTVVSRDHGATFEILCEFVAPIDGGYFHSASYGFNGRIFAAYDDGTTKVNSNVSNIAYSDDGGLTWTNIQLATNGKYDFVEQLILPITDTRLALIGRKNNYASTENYAVGGYSDDNGLTWTLFTTNLKMHCNDCAGFVHNGLIELFCLERYYTKSFKEGDMAGKITHYIGSAENFVENKMIELETHYLKAYESADLGHPAAAVDEYGNAMVITSANHEEVKNNTYPLVMMSTNNRVPISLV